MGERMNRKMISENLEEIRRRIAAGAQRAGRDPAGVDLVVITKGREPSQVAEVTAAGVRDLGENRLQELLGKASAIGEDVRWHFVGRLQTNKVRRLMREVAPALIHSVDRLPLAEVLDAEARAFQRRQAVLVQVNVSGESTKAGVGPGELIPFLRRMAGMPGLHVRGLMTMAPLEDGAGSPRQVFRRLRQLRDEVARAGISRVGMEHLSMGMSSDFVEAVEEGATIVRVGRAVFEEGDGVMAHNTTVAEGSPIDLGSGR